LDSLYLLVFPDENISNALQRMIMIMISNRSSNDRVQFDVSNNFLVIRILGMS